MNAARPPSLPPPDALLQVAAGVRVEFIGGGSLRIARDSQVREAPSSVLAVLQKLAQPASMRTVLDQLAPGLSGRLEWVEASALIVELLRLGIIERVDGLRVPGCPEGGPGREVDMHIELLEDRQRTSAFIAAIAAAVRPGDVVVDLGTGTGILAMAAARAGARKVYAIESSRFAETTRRIVEVNGLANTIEVVARWSHEIQLPEPGDVLISEIIGNDPFGEGVLRFMPDAVRRLLRPGARVLPSRLLVRAVALAMPAREAAHHRVDAAALARWQQAYGFEFGPFRAYSDTLAPERYRKPEVVAAWPRLGEPLTIAEWLVGAEPPPLVRTRHSLPLDRHAEDIAILIYSELELAPGQILSTAPWQVSQGSWRSGLVMVPKDLVSADATGLAIEVRWGGYQTRLDIRVLPPEDHPGPSGAPVHP